MIHRWKGLKKRKHLPQTRPIYLSLFQNGGQSKFQNQHFPPQITAKIMVLKKKLQE